MMVNGPLRNVALTGNTQQVAIRHTDKRDKGRAAGATRPF
jgi:hypothetical protein